MIYWKFTVDRVKFLIDSNNFLKAKEEIEKGLEKFPNQINPDRVNLQELMICLGMHPYIILFYLQL